jgi:hypothetical protein
MEKKFGGAGAIIIFRDNVRSLQSAADEAASLKYDDREWAS